MRDLVEQRLAEEAEEPVGTTGAGVGRRRSRSEVSDSDVDGVGHSVRVGIANTDNEHRWQECRDLHQPDRVDNETEEPVPVADDDRHLRLIATDADENPEGVFDLRRPQVMNLSSPERKSRVRHERDRG